MSDAEATPTIRRSGRDRKRAKPFVQDPAAPSRKRRRDTDDEGGDTTDKHSSDGGEPEHEHDTDGDDADDDDGGEDYAAPAKTARPRRQPAAPGVPRAKGKPSAAKKSRAAKAKTAPGPRKGKADASVDVVKQLKDSHISDDNSLFNTILNPAAALQSTVEDYLDSLAQSPNLALADLINCVIRACGCNDSVDADQAVDSDGVIDVLDTFTENLKNENAPLYPLASKLPVFKKFHKQLSEFIHRLITSSAEMGSLYASELMATLQSWVVAMSSSQLRSFRHTATVVAMELESALCEVAAEIEREVVVVARQREGEKKRAGKTKGKGLAKELEGKAAEVRARKNKVGEYLREFFDGVFVHRYRDHDAGIRAECVRAMGVWLARHPAQFLSGAYLRYVGWVLSDADTHVRLEAVRALRALYAQAEYMSVLQPFTDRVARRLGEIAARDRAPPVRVAAVHVLVAADAHALLADAQRAALCLLVFDGAPRVRRAVAGFVRGVWEEAVAARAGGAQARGKVGIKCLAALLVEWGRRARLGEGGAAAEEEEAEAAEEAESPVEESKARDVARLVSAQHTGRIALAVEALWDEVEALGDWEALLEHLLLDHSAAAEDALNGLGPSPVAARRRQAAAAKKKPAEEEVVDEAWRLTDAEEAALLEVFVAVLRKARDEAPGGKKGEAEARQSDMTRALMKGLPRLFAKHQTDSTRVADVLLLPQLMNVDMYLEMRMIPAYESLWGDVAKQFLSHSSPVVLGHAMAAMQHFARAALLSNTNAAKTVELEEELAAALRDAVAGRDELEAAAFSEDEVHALGALAARLVVLATARDMTAWMEEDEGGKQSSAWDIVCALAERGRLGYKEEEAMIDECLRLLTVHLAWKGRGLSLAAEPDAAAARYRETLREQRDLVLEKVTEFALGAHSGACAGVRRAAFHSLLDLHILFSDAAGARADGARLPPAALPLAMSDEAQCRCAGFVQAEIEQYAEELGDAGGGGGGGAASGAEDSASGGEDAAAGGRAGRGDAAEVPRARLEREYTLTALLAAFVRALRAGALGAAHGAGVLAHYGRLGAGVDATLRVVVDVLRELGLVRAQGRAVAEIVAKALQEAFALFLGGAVRTDEHAVALARALGACFVVRGAQLAVVRRLESAHAAAVHVAGISWAAARLARGQLRAAQFFRALQPLLGAVAARDALMIKAHLHQAVAQARVEVGAGRAWDAYRAYEKRLALAMGKDKSLGRRGRGRRAAGGGAAGASEEDEVEGLVSGSGTDGEGERAPAEDVFGPVSSPGAGVVANGHGHGAKRGRAATAEAEAEAGAGAGASPARSISDVRSRRKRVRL